MVHVIARSKVKENCMEKYMQILKENLPNVLAEEGCIRYEPCFDANIGIGAAAEADCVTILETWESADHLRAHLATPHMAAFFDAVEPLRLESVISVVNPA